MEVFWQPFRVVEGFSQMVLCCGERSQHSVRECFACGFPALLSWIELRSVLEKVSELEGLPMRGQELGHDFAVMAWTVVNEEENAVPSLLHFVQEPREVALCFPFRKCIDKCALGSRAEYVDAFVLAVYDDDWSASFARPAARNDGK